MSATKARAVLEHARKLGDGSEPQGRASMLAGLVALTSGASDGHLDEIARVLLREQPQFRDAVMRGEDGPDPKAPGIGLILIVRSATHPDLGTRLRLCNVYAEAFSMARFLRSSPTLAGIGRMAAKRLAERVDGNISGVLRAVMGSSATAVAVPVGTAVARL